MNFKFYAKLRDLINQVLVVFLVLNKSTVKCNHCVIFIPLDREYKN